mgnify:FL=1
MYIKSEQIFDNIYAIKEDIDSWIVYAPLSGIILSCDTQDLVLLKRSLAEQVTNTDADTIALELKNNEIQIPKNNFAPSQFTKLSILSNYKCNLACSYCYSAKGRSNKEISPVHLRAAINFFLGNASSGDKRSLFFSGGGEPLLSWNLLHPVLEEAIDKARRNHIDLQIHFMTNGTIFSEEIASFFKTHGISLCFSYEILESIQNLLRGKSKLVSENLGRYLNNGNIIYISSTITPQSVSYMKEMIEAVAQYFPGVNTVTMEPVTGAELYGTPEKLSQFYDEFDLNFKEAYTIAKSHGIQLNTSIQNITEHFVNRYCPGKFCLTPNGTFTICHCASSPLEERYEKCTYGYIDNDGNINFDIEKLKFLLSVNSDSYPECRDCFAKVHCGGECMTRRDTYPPEFMVEVCNHIRKNELTEIIKQLHDEQ